MENPYQPPKDPTTGPDEYPGVFKKNPRPTVITVLGILNIVFGGYALLCTPFALASTFYMPNMPQPPGPPNPVFELTKDPTYRTILVGMSVVGLAGSGVLVAAGIGLLRLKPWGRTLSLGYAAYAVVMVVFGLIFNYFYLWKPLLAAAEGKNDPQTAGAVIGAYSGMAGTVLGLIYPVVLLIFMSRPRVTAAFGRKAGGGDDDLAPLERL